MMGGRLHGLPPMVAIISTSPDMKYSVSPGKRRSFQMTPPWSGSYLGSKEGSGWGTERGGAYRGGACRPWKRE